MTIKDLRNAKFYIEHFLKIRTKDAKIIPFRLNEPQMKLYEILKKKNQEKKPVRIIILKARQMGFSTLSEAVIFHRTATKSNVSSLIIAHKDDATSNLFEMTKRFYQNLPDVLRPMKKNSNRKELVFENPTSNESLKKKNPGLSSRLRCATAGGSGVGRSDTLQNVHISEFAFWSGDKMDTLIGIAQAVPDTPESLIIIESTANGFDEFKDLWDGAVEDQKNQVEDGWTPLFVAWHEMKEYRRAVPENFRLTQEEEKLKELYSLDDEQLSWRRWCIKVNCGGDLTKFRQEYPACPEEAFIASGACVFDAQILIAQKERVRDISFRRGRFLYDFDGKILHNIRWQEDARGEIILYDEPEQGVPYVIGGDTAGEGSDYFVGQVLNNLTGKQTAILRHCLDADLYAHQMYCLGWFYNNALLAIEVNYDIYPLKLLEKLNYPNLYVREILDNFTGKMRKSYGFRTDSVTRPLIISQLVQVAREHPELILDDTTIGEMLSFIRNEKGRAEAEAGKHDDTVMALAIAHHARSQMRTVKLEPSSPPRQTLIEKISKTQKNKRIRRI